MMPKFWGSARATGGYLVALYRTAHRSGKQGVNHLCCTNTTDRWENHTTVGKKMFLNAFQGLTSVFLCVKLMNIISDSLKMIK